MFKCSWNSGDQKKRAVNIINQLFRIVRGMGGGQKCLCVALLGGKKYKQSSQEISDTVYVCMYVCMYVCIYIYIYIYVLWSYYLVQVWPFEGSLSGPRWGHYLVQVCFHTIKTGVSGDFVLLSYRFVFFLCPNIWQFSKNNLFQTKGATIGFSIFCVLSINFKIIFF